MFSFELRLRTRATVMAQPQHSTADHLELAKPECTSHSASQHWRLAVAALPSRQAEFQILCCDADCCLYRRGAPVRPQLRRRRGVSGRSVMRDVKVERSRNNTSGLFTARP